MFDLLIKGGTIVDGSGAAKRTGDVAVRDGMIVEVGRVSGMARETIDADGLIVTPGWVDIHTHYDGQVTWDPLLTPSLWHGVTTLVMGNCGVGFAPAAPDKRDWVIGLMEGVESIPGAALSAGIRWGWESFPQYLDALERMPRALDVAAQVAHGPVRAYVMGERAGELATPDDIAAQARIVREAMDAGAIGFSTSRSLLHLDVNGEFVPGTFAGEDELEALARTVVESGHGIFELTVRGMTGFDREGPPEEIAWMRRVAQKTGCPFTFLLGQTHDYPDVWRKVLTTCEAASRDGARIYPQVFGRPTNFLFTFQGVNPFSRYPAFKAIERLPWPERLRALRDPAVRQRILADHDPNDDAFRNIMKNCWAGTYELGRPLNYEPDPEDTIAARAKRLKMDPAALGYDLLLENDGTAVLYFTAFNYADGNMDTIRELLVHPLSVLGGGDGGAHVAYICDASVPTFMLTHWVRDRTRGERLGLEWVVRKQTFDTARLYGLFDRGLIKPGQRADMNLIDFDRLTLESPHFVNDLPADALRLMQTARGYVATFVAGQAVQREGRETGARPGKLVRGCADH
ncbi:MAG: amidohydrolase family protein [Alphaproteobacteria bacterium]|nr:amidohydrolase family protein [Alphaproteobacteria bacterium]